MARALDRQTWPNNFLTCCHLSFFYLIVYARMDLHAGSEKSILLMSSSNKTCLVNFTNQNCFCGSSMLKQGT